MNYLELENNRNRNKVNRSNIHLLLIDKASVNVENLIIFCVLVHMSLSSGDLFTYSFFCIMCSLALSSFMRLPIKQVQLCVCVCATGD